jgi:hypothetical protein
MGRAGLNKSAISIVLCLFIPKIIQASMIELDATGLSDDLSHRDAPEHFPAICALFRKLYEDAAKLMFYAENQNIHGFFLMLNKTKKDIVTLAVIYRPFYESNSKQVIYKYIIDIFNHTHKILELVSAAVDRLIRIDGTETFSEPIQEFYEEAHIRWREPLENLSFILFDHIYTINQLYRLDVGDLALCAQLQRVLVQSQEQIVGYALDYD